MDLAGTVEGRSNAGLMTVSAVRSQVVDHEYTPVMTLVANWSNDSQDSDMLCESPRNLCQTCSAVSSNATVIVDIMETFTSQKLMSWSKKKKTHHQEQTERLKAVFSDCFETIKDIKMISNGFQNEKLETLFDDFFHTRWSTTGLS